MKHFFSTLISMMALATAVHAAPVVISSPVDHLFIPKGFDNKGNVEVFVSGKFPNSCYSRNKVEVSVRNEKINVQITALLNREAKDCEVIDVPYMENVTIGNLQAGQYEINVNNFLKDILQVSTRSDGVDEKLYAMVNYVELGFTGGVNGDVFLIGRTTDCLAFDHMETISNGIDTLTIFPIMKKISGPCSDKRTYFNKPIRFNPQAFSNNKILLFVRTMDGKSVHALVER